jgi:3'-phosphoadenosine 5'-phosphosulfate sulfotransferase (PAPS reductase)/FAD synthetase
VSIVDSAFRAHALLPIFAKRVQRARECTRFAFELCQHPFISFSAGKDSSVMLHIAAEIYPSADARILTGGETRLLYSNLDDVLVWWKHQFPDLRLEEILIDHVFTPEWLDKSFYEQYQTFKGEWDKYLHTDLDDGVFIGLRSDESRYRRAWLRERMNGFAIRQYQSKKRSGVYRISPLADWTEKDIGAYITTREIPLLDGYDENLTARTKTRIGGQAAIRYGQLAELRQRDPENYSKLIARFPELARLT